MIDGLGKCNLNYVLGNVVWGSQRDEVLKYIMVIMVMVEYCELVKINSILFFQRFP